MDHRVQLTVALMQVDLRREQSLDELARRVNLSRSRLQHLFKAETGISPAQYLRGLRLNRARELLETSQLSIKQVMASVGISDKSHFVREFKKVHGLTPKEWRAAHRLTGGVKNDPERRLAQTATK